MNSLIWAGLALTNFVLSVTILTASSFETNILFETSASLFLLSGVFSASSWALFQAATGARHIKLKDRKTKEYVTNPREVYVKRAEYIALAGTVAWSVGTCFFLAFIGMVVTLAITVVALVLAYCYIIPRYFLWRE
jgi:hypothetical protein